MPQLGTTGNPHLAALTLEAILLTTMQSCQIWSSEESNVLDLLLFNDMNIS